MHVKKTFSLLGHRSIITVFEISVWWTGIVKKNWTVKSVELFELS